VNALLIVTVWEAIDQFVVDAAIYNASGESVLLLVWKPKGNILSICLNKSGLVVYCIKDILVYWNICQDIWRQNVVISLFFLVISVSQGSVATYIRYGRMST